MADEADPRIDPSGNVRPAVEVLPEQPWPTTAKADVTEKKLAKAEALLILIGLAFEDVEFVPRKQEVVMQALRAHLRGEDLKLPTPDEVKAIVEKD